MNSDNFARISQKIEKEARIDERNNLIKRLRAEGKSYQQIAQIVDMTPEGVRRIIIKI